MKTPALESVATFEALVSSGALFGNVDATYHMRHDKVFIFSGAEDTVVHPGKFYVLMILCVSLKGNLIYSICMYIHAYILYTGLFLPFQTRGKNKKYCMGEYFHVHIYNNPSHKFLVVFTLTFQETART